MPRKARRKGSRRERVDCAYDGELRYFVIKKGAEAYILDLSADTHEGASSCV